LTQLVNNGASASRTASKSLLRDAFDIFASSHNSVDPPIFPMHSIGFQI